MRKTLIVIALLLTNLSFVVAGDYVVKVPDCAESVTNTVTTRHLEGYVNRVWVSAPTAWTGTVAFADNVTGLGTFFTSPSATQTNQYRPVILTVHNSAGTSMATTNTYNRVWLSGNRLTLTVVSTSSASTNDIVVGIGMADK